jgi:hypothetical protein
MTEDGFAKDHETRKYNLACMRQLVCPKCKAPLRKPCVTASGREMPDTLIHEERKIKRQGYALKNMQR